ncbi:MAG: hypothetical protein JNK30_11200 [Phenylobacterium sp.]|uniref:hypothetical protein n=1 Tax=Phenylobacterium sp. TaxID=1871053 RepID=UPI001A3F74FA|nr:hypothetical protein [Phenylobacterium sp.]MBL8771938.1 hypothetical protein [Phenylobacterium sp.]
MTPRSIVAAGALFAAVAAAPAAWASTTYTGALTEAEVLSAQKAWGDALVAIAREHEAHGHAKAKALAVQVLDKAYGYNLGPVLFKPTLTVSPQTFRTTKEGALAYFVGGDAKYPNDKGFALQGWRSVEIRNAAIQIHGDTASTVGNVIMTDKDGKVTVVDKSWSFKKTDDGAIRIVAHHSSLPYAAK